MAHAALSHVTRSGDLDFLSTSLLLPLPAVSIDIFCSATRSLVSQC